MRSSEDTDLKIGRRMRRKRNSELNYTLDGESAKSDYMAIFSIFL